MNTPPSRAALRRTFPLLWCLLAALSTACAHAPSEPKSPKEITTMTTQVPALAANGNPMLSAEEIGKRFLKLLKGLESREDLSLERIREVMGITMTLQPGTLGTVHWSPELGGGWRYALAYYPASPPSPKGIDLTFEHRDNTFSDMSAICSLDFNFYHETLKSMGYRDVPIYGEIGELRSWRYHKNDLVISVIPQNVVSGEAGRVCVKSIGTLN